MPKHGQPVHLHGQVLGTAKGRVEVRTTRDDLDGGAKARALALHQHPEVVKWDRQQMRKGRVKAADA